MIRGMTWSEQPMSTLKVVELPAQQSVVRAKVGKVVRAIQAAVDALPFNSGTWRVEGTMGLYVRCRARTKSYMVQRKVGGKVVQRVLGPLTLAAARRQAQKVWHSLKPAAPEGKLTLAVAWERYLDEKPLADKTRRLYADNLERYLSAWKGRTLESLGADRAGFRARILHIARHHGVAVASQTLRCFRAIYNYHRKVMPELP